jgi:hypothetical protein
MTEHDRYDVALSFAGEQRSYVEHVWRRLKANKFKVFYDEDVDVKARHSGERFLELVNSVYAEAEFVVMVFSSAYLTKVWPSYECSAIANRMCKLFYRNTGVLIGRFDNSELPDVPYDIWYEDYNDFDNIIAMMNSYLKKNISVNDSLFAHYSIACAKARQNIIEEAFANLVMCIKLMRTHRVGDMAKFSQAINDDDDLLDVRIERTNELASFLDVEPSSINTARTRKSFIGTFVPSGRGGGCVDPDASDSFSIPANETR